jgi:hypothetical protein
MFLSASPHIVSQLIGTRPPQGRKLSMVIAQRPGDNQQEQTRELNGLQHYRKKSKQPFIPSWTDAQKGLHTTTGSSNGRHSYEVELEKEHIKKWLRVKTKVH